MSLRIENLNKTYGVKKVLKDVSFEIKDKSIHGFLGPNGAGKSTTIKIISSIISRDSGEIDLNGLNPDKDPLLYKSQIGVLAENPPLYEGMKVCEYLRFVCQLYKMRKSDITHAIERVIGELSLEDVYQRYIGNLSKGYKQKVGVAQAIVHDPKFVILDEPTAALDPNAVIEMRTLIKKLATQKTVLFSSHQLSEVEQLCQDITMIHHGKIVATGSKEKVIQSQHQSYIYLLRCDDVTSKMEQDIAKISSILSVNRVSDGLKVEVDQEDNLNSILEYIVANKIRLKELRSLGQGLESFFLNLSKEIKS